MRPDHGSRTVEDAAWQEHQRAMDEYVDDRPTRADA